MENNQKCFFGSFNTETGETMEGYVDQNNKMQFKETPYVSAKQFQIPGRWIWQDPKFIIMCAKCFREFTSKNYLTHTDKRYFPNKIGNIMCCCPHCGKWNILPLVEKRR